MKTKPSIKHKPLATFLSPALLAEATAARVHGLPLFRSLQPVRSIRARAA